jgi:hypothetical protein
VKWINTLVLIVAYDFFIDHKRAALRVPCPHVTDEHERIVSCHVT